MKHHLCAKYTAKTYLFKGNFKTHLLMPTIEKPYICEIFSGAFSQSGNLMRRLLIQNKRETASLLECCKAFSQQSNLNVNLLTYYKKKFI